MTASTVDSGVDSPVHAHALGTTLATVLIGLDLARRGDVEGLVLAEAAVAQALEGLPRG